MSTPLVSTQQRYPWRAAGRTFAQVVIALPVVLLILSAILAIIAGDAFATYLPDGWVAWIGGVSVATAALAALLARIMALPAIDRLLKRLASSPAVSR